VDRAACIDAHFTCMPPTCDQYGARTRVSRVFLCWRALGGFSPQSAALTTDGHAAGSAARYDLRVRFGGWLTKGWHAMIRSGAVFAAVTVLTGARPAPWRAPTDTAISKVMGSIDIASGSAHGGCLDGKQEPSNWRECRGRQADTSTQSCRRATRTVAQTRDRNGSFTERGGCA